MELVELQQLRGEGLPGPHPAVRRRRRRPSFRMVRDAGTVAFEGELDQVGGSGRFSFSANPEYLAALKSMGYAAPNADKTSRWPSTT